MSYLIDRAEEAQKRKLDFAREQSDRAAVASGNVDENSALYRHAKLSGWNMGDGPQHGKAGRKWEAAALADQGRMMDARADMMEAATRRSPISIFSSSDAPATPQQQMFAQMGDLIQRGNAARQKKRNMDDAALASALVYAKQNNGFIPPDMLQAMSAQLGRDIAGGNYTSDGNFVLYGRENIQSTNGKVRGEQFVPIAMASPDMQMSVLQRSGIGQDLQKSLWDAMTAPGKLTPQQVMERGHKNPYADDLVLAEKARKWQLEADENRRQFDAKMQLEREKLAAGGGGKYDNDLAERLYAKVDRLEEKYANDRTPEQQKEIEDAQAEADSYVSRHAGGATAARQQGGMSGVDAKRQELIRRGLLNPDGSPKRPAADNGGQQSGTAQQQETTTQQNQPVGKENPGANSPAKTEEPPDESRRFMEAGGEYSEDEDTGLRRVKIRNWDYLSPEEQQGWNEEMQESEGDSEGLMMGSIADLQARANARKSEVDKKWEAEAQRLEADWKRRGWTQKRIDNALDKSEEKWRLENDPAAKRRRRENENKIRGFFPE